MPIEAVVFDLDGVYFENGSERFIESLAETYRLSEKEIRDVYSRSSEMREYKLGRMAGQDFWSYASSAWGIPATQQQLLAMISDAYEENPRIVAFIRELKSRNVKVAACTNNFKERLDLLESKFRFRRHFDVFIASCEVGVLKPDDRIFDLLAARLQLPRDSILMSDDRQSNVDALKRLGFQAFVYGGLDDLRRRVFA